MGKDIVHYIRLLNTSSNLALNASRDRAPTTSLIPGRGKQLTPPYTPQKNSSFLFLTRVPGQIPITKKMVLGKVEVGRVSVQQ